MYLSEVQGTFTKHVFENFFVHFRGNMCLYDELGQMEIACIGKFNFKFRIYLPIGDDILTFNLGEYKQG